jgi:hypothetical protein
MNSLDTRRNFLRLAAGGMLGAVRGSAAACSPGIPRNPLKSKPAPGQHQSLLPEKNVCKRPLLTSSEGQEANAKLMWAYSQLLSRNPKNQATLLYRTSLYYQMWLHDVYCSDGPANIHSTWAFLPWHRAFLYFHERILRSILGDSFRLPVWDWENEGNVPPPYETWAAANLCKHAYSNLGEVMMKCSAGAWLFSSSFEDFAGYPLYFMENGNSPAGNAPNGPHSYVHARIGGAFSPSATAAADPIFYAHHANVDRFWAHWSKAHPDFKPQSAAFGAQPFCFYDESGKPKYVTAADFLNPDLLGYTYDQPSVRVPTTSDLIADGKDPVAFFKLVVTNLRTYLKDPKALFPTVAQEIEHAIQKTWDEIGELLMPGDLELPFSVSFNSSIVKPGTIYLVSLAPLDANDQARQMVAGFGVFGDPKHSHGPILATGCLGSKDLAFVAAKKGSVKLIYGPAGGNMVRSDIEYPIELPYMRLLKGV